MGVEDDCGLLEAALYAREGFLSLREAKQIVGTSSETYLKKLTERLVKRLGEKRGPFKLVQSETSLSLRLKDDYLSKLEGFIPKVRLSRGTLKTLSLVAYKQPILQSDLVKMRGKRVYDHLKVLETLGFVEARSYQRTKVLKTTPKFSGYFGLEGDIESIPIKLAEKGREIRP